MKKKYTEDDIQTLTARDAVRLKPTLFLSKIFESGNLNSLPIEVACHAIDEFYDNKCSTIEITIFKNYFSIKYDAGMSLSRNHGDYKAILLMTSVFACRNEKKHLAVGEEFCELGIANVNFSSKFCTVDTVWNGQKGYFQFEEGILKEHSIETDPNGQERTEMVFHPDPAIFGELKLTFSGVEKLIKEVQKKLEGLTIQLKDATYI